MLIKKVRFQTLSLPFAPAYAEFFGWLFLCGSLTEFRNRGI